MQCIGIDFVAGALTEAGGQRFNDGIYLVVERVTELALPGQGGMAATALMVAVIMGATVLTAIRADGSARGALVAGSWVLGAYILVAPVVEPWYFTWLAPLIALQLLRPGERAATLWVLAWIWLAGTGTLTDLTYLPGTAGWWPAIRAAEYVPAYLLLAAGLALHLRRRGQRERLEPDVPASRNFVRVGERS